MNALCRTCLRSSGKLHPLANQLELVHKIETIAPIQVHLKKGFPASICEECITNVKKFYNFRKVIINSTKDLEERSKTCDASKENNNRSKPANNSVFIKDEKCEDANAPPKSPSKENSGLDRLVIEATPDFADSDAESGGGGGGGDEDRPFADSSDEADVKSEEEEEEEEADVGGDEGDGGGDADKSIERAIALLKIYRCGACNKTFPSRFKLSNHRRTEHYPRSMCNICGAIIRSDNIRRHVQLHSEGPVACKICGKVCKNSESLRGHSLIHRGEIYTCDICGKSSRLKAEYKRHLKMHDNPEIGKQMCSLCGKKVKDLKKHMLSHTGERPHVCTYCRKGFTSPYALKVHTRQHTNEKPYMCDYCPMAFPQKVSLVMHIKSKHKPKTEVE